MLRTNVDKTKYMIMTCNQNLSSWS